MIKIMRMCFLFYFLFHSLSFAQEEQSPQRQAQPGVEEAVAGKKKIVPAANIEELTNQLEALIEHHGIPGLSVAVVKDGKLALVAGIGLSNIDTQTPTNENTLFRIGSISKMFVSLAALKLESEGKLDLKSPIKALIPEIEFHNPYAETDPIRVIHLLQHTTGWDDIHLPEYANNNPAPITLKEGLDYHPDSRISRWRPGSRMSYANSGPPVAAYIIQKITGVEFEKYVQTHFFNPLEMHTATFRAPKTQSTTLYVNKAPVDYWHIIMRPSGAINASARDMANFLHFLSNSGTFKGNALLPASSIRKMEVPTTTLAAKAGMTHGYGLANFPSYYKGYQFHGHNGGVQGGSSVLAYLPEHNMAFTFAINSNTSARQEIFDALASYVTQQLPQVKFPTNVSLSEEKADRYSGYYMPVNPRQEMMRFIEQITGVKHLSLTTQGGTLKDSAGEQKYVVQSENLLRLSDERPVASVALLADEQGIAIDVSGQYLQKISAFRHYAQQGFMWIFVGLLAFHLLWFFWWMGRKLLGKINSKSAIQVRLWTFLASCSIYAVLIAAAVGQMLDVFGLLGKVSWASVTIMVSSYLFAIFTLISVIQNIRYFKTEIHWFSKYVSLFTCFVYAVVTIYFASLGVIGLQTFA